MQTRLEHEEHLLRSSIALLAAGGARRVTLIGLTFGERMLPEAAPAAKKAGMVLRPIRSATRCDITVEPSA